MRWFCRPLRVNEGLLVLTVCTIFYPHPLCFIMRSIKRSLNLPFCSSWQCGVCRPIIHPFPVLMPKATCICSDSSNLSVSTLGCDRAPAARLQTLDRTLPDRSPSSYDSPSEDFYTGNENKLPLFSDIRLPQNRRSQLNRAFCLVQ